MRGAQGTGSGQSGTPPMAKKVQAFLQKPSNRRPTGQRRACKPCRVLAVIGPECTRYQAGDQFRPPSLIALFIHYYRGFEMNVVNQDRLAEIASLKRGGHTLTDGEMCVMEAVAYVAGERWSDAPQCACPVITSFMVSWNDNRYRKNLLGSTS